MKNEKLKIKMFFELFEFIEFVEFVVYVKTNEIPEPHSGDIFVAMVNYKSKTP